MLDRNKKTLRIQFPQWQGGNNSAYYFGSMLLSALIPKTGGLIEEIPVEAPSTSILESEDGIVGRAVLKRQLYSVQKALDKHNPDKVVVLGGDCFVDLAPFAYLNKLYNNDLGILWIDAHPDVMTPKDFNHAHAMVLGNLMGYGDNDFRSAVEVPVQPENILFVGLGEVLPVESDFIKQKGLLSFSPEILNNSIDPVMHWLEQRSIKRLAIHLDLDVLDPLIFHSTLFNNPDVPSSFFDGITKGKMKLETLEKLLSTIEKTTDIVGFGIAEYFPWDALKLSEILSPLSILNGK